MANHLHKIAHQLFNQPLLCTQSYAETVISFLGERVGVDNSSLDSGEFTARTDSVEASNGIAVVPVIGSLVHRAGNMDAPSGMRSYQAITAELDAAVESNAHTIVMEYDTPGGSVSGAFDLADKINAIADDPSKPRVIAFVNGTCASAGYLLASQANQIFATKTSMVGSIGVVIAHLDITKKNEMEGIKPTFIHKGARKVDGNPNIALSDEALESFEEAADEAYEMFVGAVTQGRGISAESVKNTEAAMFGALTGVEMGLVDMIIPEDEIIATAFGLAQSNQGVGMSKENMFTQEQMDTALASAVQAEAAKATSAVDMAVSEERNRISGIMALEEYKGREPLAQKFIDKGMSVEDTKEFLASSPVEKSTVEAEAPAGAGQMAAMNAIIEESTADVKPAVADQMGASAVAGANPEQVTREAAIAAASSIPGTRGAMRRNA